MSCTGPPAALQAPKPELGALQVLQNRDRAAQLLRGCAHGGTTAGMLSERAVREIQAGNIQAGGNKLVLEAVGRRTQCCNERCCHSRRRAARLRTMDRRVRNSTIATICAPRMTRFRFSAGCQVTVTPLTT
jgi:hypothetical protein